MEIRAELVKELRELTGAGVMQCKKALLEAKGDKEEAGKILAREGTARAQKRADRATEEGLVASYVHHGGRIGVLVEVNCETDFVARTDDFRNLVKDIALHVAAMAPAYLGREDVPKDVVREKEGKNELEQFYREQCLLEQPFVKEAEVTVGAHFRTVAAKLGENLRLRRFVRYQLGEELGEEKKADLPEGSS